MKLCSSVISYFICDNLYKNVNSFAELFVPATLSNFAVVAVKVKYSFSLEKVLKNSVLTLINPRKVHMN